MENPAEELKQKMEAGIMRQSDEERRLHTSTTARETGGDERDAGRGESDRCAALSWREGQGPRTMGACGREIRFCLLRCGQGTGETSGMKGAVA